MVKIIAGERIGKLGRLAVGCSATILDPTKQKILLTRRADNGHWCVPGGYMEPGESISEVCAREVLEETGLHVQVKRLVGVYTTPHHLLEYADGNRWQLVVLHFETECIGGELKVSNETTELGFFSRTEAESLQMNELDRKRVADSLAQQTAAFVRDDFMTAD